MASVEISKREIILSKAVQQNARSLALAILEDVLENDAYANLALSKRLSEASLSQTDRALVTEIVYGSLTRKKT